MPQPLFELSFNPEELKFRLATVPVYTVVNNKDEFVLVSGEVSSAAASFFMVSRGFAVEERLDFCSKASTVVCGGGVMSNKVEFALFRGKVRAAQLCVAVLSSDSWGWAVNGECFTLSCGAVLVTSAYFHGYYLKRSITRLQLGDLKARSRLTSMIA